MTCVRKKVARQKSPEAGSSQVLEAGLVNHVTALLPQDEGEVQPRRDVRQEVIQTFFFPNETGLSEPSPHPASAAQRLPSSLSGSEQGTARLSQLPSTPACRLPLHTPATQRWGLPSGRQMSPAGQAAPHPQDTAGTPCLHSHMTLPS